MKKHGVVVEWKNGNPAGAIEVTHGVLAGLRALKGKGRVNADKFRFSSGNGGRLLISFRSVELVPGAESTLVSVRARGQAFSFLLRDISRSCPVWIPEYEVVVTEGNDPRDYAAITAGIRKRELPTSIQRMETEPETTFALAAENALNQSVPTWLGVSRNMRLFEIGFREGSVRYDWVMTRAAGYASLNDEQKKEFGLKPDFDCRYAFCVGRGVGYRRGVSRWLEDGVLPILHATVNDGGVNYHVAAYAALADKALTPANLRGTHFLVADRFGRGYMQTDGQKRICNDLLRKESAAGEDTVLCIKIVAENVTPTPRYAWISAPSPEQKVIGASYDPLTGFGAFPSGHVFAVCRMNGCPMPQEEIAVLLKPGKSADFEWLIPNRPVLPEQARRLLRVPLETRRQAVRKFWRKKLDSAAQIDLPEKRINEMLKAGLLHLDMICYGHESKGTLVPAIGVYTAIGSESAPIIQFMDSMGWHRTAERNLQYFLDKQHDDGFIQNFGGYMLETGAALWSMGEHFRYTRDVGWVRLIARQLLKSCDFIIAWRERNKRPELRGKGFGMLDGKCADPEDPYHAFMLNGFGYLGLERVAEMLFPIMSAQSRRLRREAAAFRLDIRKAFFESVAKSPVVPLQNGTWVPSAPPWVEAQGPVALYTDRARWCTHGTFMGRDTLIGPLWLIFQEILQPDETMANWMMLYHTDLMFMDNVVFSQPYYCRHDWSHLKRGEVRSFLKLYYHTMAGLADRETYTFWEHFFHVSPHKTHEEAWFLMQTRWMLYLEEGRRLNLMSGIPRAWLADGNVIRLKNVKSYFGPLNIEVNSNLANNEINAFVECRSPQKPDSVLVRLPHPEGRPGRSVAGGKYCPEREAVLIESFSGRSKVRINF